MATSRSERSTFSGEDSAARKGGGGGVRRGETERGIWRDARLTNGNLLFPRVKIIPVSWHETEREDKQRDG